MNGGLECVVCGGRAWKFPICSECQKRHYDVKVALEKKRCSVCGRPLISEVGECMECRNGSVFKSTEKIVPIFEYQLWNKELLFEWKILGERVLSPFFAEKVSHVLKMIGAKVVVPVPPRKGKIQKKGWDQIDELCKFLEFCYGYKVLKILQRLSGGEQKKLSRESRLNTIGHSYSLVQNDSLARQLKLFNGKIPKEVCLVDDILTTGSTIESCAAILRAAGVEKVNAITLFIAS